MQNDNIKIPSVKESLSVHFKAIKNYIEYANNTTKATEKHRFSKTYDARLGINCLNNAISYINSKAKDWFKTKEEFMEFAKSYGFKTKRTEIAELEESIADEDYFKKVEEVMKTINLDLFDKIEEIISPEESVQFRKAVEGNGKFEFERSHVHLLNDKVNELKNNIPNNLSKEEKDDYIKALDNINAKVLKKVEDGFIEGSIEDEAKLIKTYAKYGDNPPIAGSNEKPTKDGLIKYADSLGFSEKEKEAFLKYEVGTFSSSFDFYEESPDKIEKHHKIFSTIFEKVPRMKLGDDVKNNIIGLSQLVNKSGIFKEYTSGETGSKEYGFLTFFNKQIEIYKLLNQDISKLSDEEKKKYSQEVIKKSNELNDIEAKYDEVLDYINKNFDMDKITISGNIYSGRPPAGLLEKWDNKNARAGVILNGLAQLYGACKNANMSIEEYLNDPEKGMRQSYENAASKIKNNYILPREGNSLGKRIARACVNSSELRYYIGAVIFSNSRGIEFLYHVDTDRENAAKNVLAEALIATECSEEQRGSKEYLRLDDNSLIAEPNYDNLMNVLLFGDDKENIFETCDNYYTKEFKKLPALTANDYMEKYKKMMENPSETFKKITEDIKDFIKEREIIRKENQERAKNGGKELSTVDDISAEHLVVASKFMLENMLTANKKTLKDIKDPIARKNIQAFLKNPAKALDKMFPNQLGMDKDDLQKFEEKIQVATNVRSQTLQNNFIDIMMKNGVPKEVINNQNDKAGMYKVLDDHPIGFFEGIFSTKATRNYRKLINALDGLYDPESSGFGKVDKVAKAAEAYLEHKYKGGKTIDDLKGEAKERAKFCENIIESYKKSFKLEADLFLNKNVTDNKKEKTINQEEKIVDKALDNPKEVNNNLENEKEVNVIVDKEPERKSVFGLEGDVDIENNKIKKTESTKTNTKVKVVEKEDVKDMNHLN